MLKQLTSALAAFAAWVGHSPLTAAVVDTPWIIPTVQVIHIMAVAFTLAAVVIINLRVLGLIEVSEPLNAVADRFLPTLPVTLSILAVTGFLLIAGEPTRAIFRYVFWLKMSLIVAAAGMAWGLGQLVRSGRVPTSGKGLLAFRGAAIISLSLWLAIIVAGRWIGYAGGWPGSPQ